MSYFDLSGFANLKELPREQEAASPPIYIPNGLLFGNQIATSVYVSLHFACLYMYLFVNNFDYNNLKHLMYIFVFYMQVNENGLFSFNKPFFFSHPNQFPTDNVYSRLSNVVAPFWSDNDIRKNGTVRYVDIDIRYPLNLTQDHEKHVISEVLAHLKETGTTGTEQEFRPKWMIVAQWDKVPPFSQEGVSSKVYVCTRICCF